MAKCAFLGLGVMGYPMAGHLLAAGHPVTVWNRTGEKAASWAKDYDGKFSQSIAGAVSEAEFIFMCVGDDQDVYDVIEQALPHIQSGSVIVDHTTASADCARSVSEKAQAKNIGFIDAPISGGESGAINGQLTVMCGGNQSEFDRAEPIIQSYAKFVKLMGPSGAGQLTKMVNQICIAGILQGLAEGVHFAQTVGLDVTDVVDAIGKGAAQSWQMDNRAITMSRDEFEFGFAVDWMRKDLRISLETAGNAGVDLPVTKIVDNYYKDIQSIGGGRWDTSSLLRRFNRPT